MASISSTVAEWPFGCVCVFTDEPHDILRIKADHFDVQRTVSFDWNEK